MMTALNERDEAIGLLDSLTLSNEELARERDLAEERIVTIQEELDSEKAASEEYVEDLQICMTEI